MPANAASRAKSLPGAGLFLAMLLLASSDLWPGERILATGPPAAAGAQGDPLFPYPVYPAERVTGIADMNHDGHPDIVLGDYYWLVLLAEPSGGYRASPGTLAGIPRSGAIADLNLDGKLDVVTGGALYLGAGDGTLSEPISLGQTATSTRSVLVLGDFDRDGRPDLVATASSGRIVFTPGLGNGSFGAARVVASGVHLDSLVGARLDADDLDDLVAVSSDRRALYRFLGRGDGTFEALAAIPLVGTLASLVAVHADAGPSTDLVVGYTCSPTPCTAGGVELWLGAGDGSLVRAGRWLPTEPVTGADMADFTGDGLPDLATVGGTRTLTILSGVTGGATLFGEPVRRLVGAPLGNATMASLDDEPGTELIVGGLEGTVILRDLAEAQPTLPVDVTGTRSAHAAVAGDWNRDGQSDLAFLENAGGTARLYVVLAGAARTFVDQLPIPLAFSATRIFAGDLHSDGTQDLIVGSAGAPLVTLHGRGDGAFDPPVSLMNPAFGWDDLVVFDADRDGRNDLLLTDPTASQARVIVYSSRQDGTLAPPASITIGGSYPRLAIADFNGDGLFDVVTPRITQSPFANGLDLRLQTSPGVFGSPRSIDSFPQVFNLRFKALDYSGDGIQDIAIINPAVYGEGPLALLKCDGAGGFDARFAPTLPYGVDGFPTAGDFDADGRTDLAVHHTIFVRVLLGDDGGLAGEGQDYVGHAPSELLSGDFDGDGASDVAIRSNEGRLIVLYSRALDGHRNSGPTAVAAAMAEAECSGPSGATVTLDGRESSDPDSSPGSQDDIASYEWYEDFEGAAERLLGAGASLDATFALGAHSVTLKVTDQSGEADAATIEVRVVDTQAPSLSVFTDPATLWPPNHQMVPVGVRFAAADLCDAGVRVELVSVVSSEPDDAPGGDDGQTTADVQHGDVWSADASIELRAERGGKGAGRTYTLTYRALDLAGHATTAVGLVIVPHDQGQGPEPLQQRLERAGPGNEMGLFWPAVPGATSYDVIRGDLAAWRAADGVLRLGAVEVLARGVTTTSITEVAGTPNPPPGKAWFYLVQQTTERGAVGYGTESAPWPRVPDACTGGCPGGILSSGTPTGGAAGPTGAKKR